MAHKNVEKTTSTTPMLPKEKTNLELRLPKTTPHSSYENKSPTAPPETPKEKMSLELRLPKTTPHSSYEKKSPSAPPETTDEKTSLELRLPKTTPHSSYENKSPTAPPETPNNENGAEKMVIITPNSNGVGKILIREDTILANLQGCAGCGRGQFTCAGVKKQMSVLCWGRQSDRKYYCLLVLLSATFVFSLIGTIFFCFTNTLNNAILSNMVIRNNSLAYSVWRRPNVQPLMKVHIFNYTNWQRVRSGKEQTLKVEEMGPYVYSQQLERVNVEFEGDRLSFQERNQFKYLPNKTVGAHFDQLFVPNLPLLGVVSKAKTLGMNIFATQFLFNTLLPTTNHPDAFVKLPVHRFLWGYDDTIINMAKPYLMLQGEFKFNQFGLLVARNGTVSERFTINTGEKEMDKMNIIEQVDGQSHLDHWNDPECNRIDASDGSIFPPSMLDKKQTLYIFNPNLCRRLPFVFEKEIKIDDGIVLYRYRMPRNVFDNPSQNPANQCYCEMDDGVCPPQGVINVTACTMGAPAMVSFPHFYLGDPRLRSDILGLRPDPALHDTHVDIHPTLGIALQGRSVIQINIQVRKPSFITAVNYLPEGLILPVAWIEMSVEELPESLKSLVYHGTYSTAAVQLGLSVISILALVTSSTCLLLMLMQRRRKPCATLKKVAVEVREGMEGKTDEDAKEDQGTTPRLRVASPAFFKLFLTDFKKGGGS